MNALFVVWLGSLACVPPAALAQDTGAGFNQLLSLIPLPPTNAAEALNRCLADEDTIAAAVLRRLKAPMQDTTGSTDALQAMLEKVDEEFLANPRLRFEQEIRAIGERVDSAIRACPKVRDRHGRLVYDSLCVVRAEMQARHSRVEAVNRYLQEIWQAWPAYLEEIRRLPATTSDHRVYVARRTVLNVAAITQTAALFAK